MQQCVRFVFKFMKINIYFQFVYKDQLLEYRLQGEIKWRGLKTKWKWRCMLKITSTGQEVESDWYLGHTSTLADALRRANIQDRRWEDGPVISHL